MAEDEILQQTRLINSRKSYGHKSIRLVEIIFHLSSLRFIWVAGMVMDIIRISNNMSTSFTRVVLPFSVSLSSLSGYWCIEHYSQQGPLCLTCPYHFSIFYVIFFVTGATSSDTMEPMLKLLTTLNIQTENGSDMVIAHGSEPQKGVFITSIGAKAHYFFWRAYYVWNTDSSLYRVAYYVLSHH